MRAHFLENELSYWRQQLDGCPDLDLPTDRPRPTALTHDGAVVLRTLPSELCKSLERSNRIEGVTMFMTMLTAFQVLLARYTGKTDIVVGSAIANRNRRELEDLIGFFVNCLPMRSKFSGQPDFPRTSPRP